MDEQEEVQQNMISNLPLLFANGYPTSLDKITESQLEKFIPFMVRCSLGHINFQEKTDCSEPEWWPEDFPFTIPFTKPKKFNGNWAQKMKEIIIICYQFHRSVFLLRFCNDLAAYEHASLRFINNYNSTTSLFERRSNKLLVTFRNENMSYDQPQRSRKCLMRQKSKSGNQDRTDVEQIMVEPAPFDIYLCDNCDAELYSKEAILEHEKTCNVDDDDDDVILCDTPEPSENNNNNIQQTTDAERNTEDQELRNGFLLNFNLQCRDSKNGKVPTTNNNNKSEPSTASASAASTNKDSNEKTGFMIVDRNKRMPRRNRAGQSLQRCPTIPLSSPAGQLLLRTTKTVITPEYLNERLDRLERFCFAPLLSKSSPHMKPSKYFEKKTNLTNVHCTFKKPQQDYSTHVYVFPRRQFSQRRRTESFLFLNSSLIRRCRPISVRLKKITDNEVVKNRRSLLPSSSSNTKLNIKLTRDATRRSNWKISSSPSTEIIVDTIDLCSTDDEDGDENCGGATANASGSANSTCSSDIKKTNAIVQRRTVDVGAPATAMSTTAPMSIEMVRKAIALTLSSNNKNSSNSNCNSNHGMSITISPSNFVTTNASTLTTNTNTTNSTKGSIAIIGGNKKISINTPEISLIPIRKSTRNNGPIKGPDKIPNRTPATTTAVSTEFLNKTLKSTISTINVSSTSSSAASSISTVAAVTAITDDHSSSSSSNSNSSKSTTTFNLNALLTSPTTTIFATPEHGGVAGVGGVSGITLPKPLQPSVYIFSNYAANALTSAAASVPTSNNEIITPTNGAVINSLFKNQNQENRAQNGGITVAGAVASGAIVKHHQLSNNNIAAAPSPATITPDWYPELSAATINNSTNAPIATNLSNTKQAQAHLVERERAERAARSLSLVSPSRVISIDLTS